MAFHLRIAQLFTPAAFALVGASLALSGRTTGRTRGYFLTFMAYVSFYVLTRMFENMGAKGQLPLGVAAHLPNLIFALGGSISAYRVFRGGAR
jgi:lipopolysaccharide export system permease protein